MGRSFPCALSEGAAEVVDAGKAAFFRNCGNGKWRVDQHLLGLWELFDNVWSCDDFNTTKADPQIYVRAVEKMNTTVENVLFLDDNLNADQTAKAAGMQVCGVYDESSKDYVEQMKAANDYYIYDFQELLHI